MKSRYTMFAAYNRWANDRLYAVAAKLKHLHHVVVTIHLTLLAAGGAHLTVDAAGHY